MIGMPSHYFSNKTSLSKLNGEKSLSLNNAGEQTKNGVTNSHQHLRYASSTRPDTIHRQGHDKSADLCIAKACGVQVYSHKTLRTMYIVMENILSLGRNRRWHSMKTGIDSRSARNIAKAKFFRLVGVGESYLSRASLLVIFQFSNRRMDWYSRIDSNSWSRHSACRVTKINCKKVGGQWYYT